MNTPQQFRSIFISDIHLGTKFSKAEALVEFLRDNVYFIAGNHDEFLRPFVPILLGDRLKIVSEMEYVDLRGKRYLVTHGDFFDSITMTKKWLAVLGDYGYDLLLHLNGFVNLCRRVFGIQKYWSLSKYAKDSIKSSVSFISDYEGILANHAKHNEYDGVICGHIHKAEMRSIDGVEYLNCGDWVESCSAVAETMDGQWQIIHFLER